MATTNTGSAELRSSQRRSSAQPTQTTSVRPGNRNGTRTTSRRGGARRNSRPQPPRTPLVTATGTFSANPRGFGFVRFDEPLTNPLDANAPIDSAFVTPIDARELFADDRVEVKVDVSDGRGTVTHVLSHTRVRTQVFGQVVSDRGRMLLVADPNVTSGKVTIPARAVVTAGHWVLLDLAARQVVDSFPTLTPAAVRTMVFARHRFPTGHTPKVLEQGERLASQTLKRLAVEPRKGRRDFTDMTTVTIDGPTSRDLDDAISAQRVGDGVRVWVHVADVAAAVPAGSAVDLAARESATSVYLPGWNRPMLPPALSEQAVSLLPGVARDTVTVAYTVTPHGSVTDIDVQPGRIVSDAQLTYAHTSAVLAGTETAQTPQIDHLLRTASQAAESLATERSGRSSLTADYSSDREVHAGVATTGHEDPYTGAVFAPEQVTAAHATETLIERLMVAANESLATWLRDRNLPGMFRAHGRPALELVEDLAVFASHAEVALPLTSQDPIGRYLALVAATDDTAALHGARTLLMRHTAKAVYTPEPGHHFGLSSDGYLHFTSPLRRYADLLVHRVVHAHLAGQSETVAGLAALITGLADHVSGRAAAAGRAEAEFRRHANVALFTPQSPVTAVVSGFSPKGMFVTVPETGLSGQLMLTSLPGRWGVDDRKVAAVQAGTGKVMHLGDMVQVVCDEVDAATAQVSFATTARKAS